MQPVDHMLQDGLTSSNQPPYHMIMSMVLSLRQPPCFNHLIQCEFCTRTSHQVRHLPTRFSCQSPSLLQPLNPLMRSRAAVTDMAKQANGTPKSELADLIAALKPKSEYATQKSDDVSCHSTAYGVLTLSDSRASASSTCGLAIAISVFSTFD